MAIDLGTTNTLIYSPKKADIVLRQPSMVAIDKSNGRVVAVGEEAKDMLGRTPDNIAVINPLKDGVIADIDVAEAMLYLFLKYASKRRFTRPLVIIPIPSVLTKLEQGAVLEVAEQAGARKVYLMKKPMASALGAGIPVSQPVGNIVVDIGGGTTEAAVIAVRNAEEVLNEAYQMEKRMHALIRRRLAIIPSRLVGMEKRRIFKDPMLLVEKKSITLDHNTSMMIERIRRRLEREWSRVNG